MTEPDEGIYYKAFTVLKRISDYQFQEALHLIYTSNGRPLGVVVNLIPASLQVLWAKFFGLNVFETHSMPVIFFFNLVTYFLILYLIYKIAILLFQNRNIGILSILLYSLLTNSHIYLRHVLPYDLSLLFFLYVLYKLLYYFIFLNDCNIFIIFRLGIINFLGFMLYPGNFPLYLATFLILIGFQLIQSFKKKYFLFSSIFAFVSGTILVIIPVEFLSCIGKYSYINSLQNLSGTILQGDFNESAVFLFKYMWDVEGITGILWLVGLVLFLFHIPKLLKTKNYYQQYIILISFIFIGLLVFYTVFLSFFLHKMVVYGRIIHQFILVLTIFSVYGYYLFCRKYIYSNLFLSLLLFLGLANFFSNFLDYMNISYPKNVFWKYLRHTSPEIIKEVSEYKESWSNLPSAHYIKNEKINNTKDTILAINTQYFFPVEHLSKFNPYKVSNNYKLIFKGKHFLNFKAYQYEGYTPNARKIIRKIKPEIKIYKKKD